MAGSGAGCERFDWKLVDDVIMEGVTGATGEVRRSVCVTCPCVCKVRE